MLVEDRDMLLDQLGFALTEEQVKILNHPARIKLVAGGERAGKSFMGAVHILSKFDEVSDNGIIWLVARDYERCRAEFEYLLDMLGRLGLLKSASKRIDPGEIQCVNGIRIKTKSAQDYRSLAMEAPDGIVACEASQIDFESFLRLRGRIAEKRGWLFLEGTFEASLGWYPSRFEAWQMHPNPDDAISFSLPSWSNSVVYPGGRNDPEILSLERLHSDTWFMERLAGKPSPPKGLVHPLFDVALHVSEDAQYVAGQPVYLWVDPGYSSITQSAYAVEVVQKIDDQVRIIDEIYEREKTTEDIIEIAQNREWWQDVDSGVIDIAAHAQSERRPVDVWWHKANVSMISEKVGVMDGIERFNTFLKPHPVSNKPNMIFNPQCRGIISELGGCQNPFDGQVHVYSWRTDRNGNVVGREPRDAFNHGAKAIVYGLVINFGYARLAQEKTKITVKRW